jgi:class 3 adenylate cyclase
MLMAISKEQQFAEKLHAYTLPRHDSSKAPLVMPASKNLHRTDRSENGVRTANPERVSKLILFGGFAKAFSTDEAVAQRIKIWGTGVVTACAVASLSTNPDAVKLLAKFERLSASPGTAKAFMLLNRQIDVTSILPNVRVPTLVLHRRTDAFVPIERGRELAALIPGAKFIEYPEGDHVPFTGDAETILGDIQEFVTGERESSASDLERILATVMFTDIVDSTRSAVEMDDQQWHRLLDSHDRIAKRAVEKHRGNLIKTTEDALSALQSRSQTQTSSSGVPEGITNPLHAQIEKETPGWVDQNLHSGWEMMRADLTHQIHDNPEEAAAKIHPGHEAVAAAMNKEGTPPNRVLHAGFMPRDKTSQGDPIRVAKSDKDSSVGSEMMIYPATPEKGREEKLRKEGYIRAGEFEKATGIRLSKNPNKMIHPMAVLLGPRHGK